VKNRAFRNKVYKVCKVHKVHKVCKVHKVHKVFKVCKVCKVFKWSFDLWDKGILLKWLAVVTGVTTFVVGI
jgi:hypothetical protein